MYAVLYAKLYAKKARCRIEEKYKMLFINNL